MNNKGTETGRQIQLQENAVERGIMQVACLSEILLTRLTYYQARAFMVLETTFLALSH